MQVVVDGLLTNYQRSGKGKVVVLLHGWGNSAHGLSAVSRLLAQHYDVVVPDLPGFGQTQAPHAVWGLDEYATFVSQFLQKIEVAPFAIGGHSNGGAIAIRGLANGSLTTQKLVLLSSAGIRNQYKGRVKAIRYVTKAGKALTTPLPGRVKQRLRSKVYSTIGSDMLVAEHLQDSFKKVVTDDVLTDAEKISVPTLLVYGDQDTATPPEYGHKLMQRIPNSKLEIIPGAGHFIVVENAARVAAMIEEFLQ